MLWHRNLRVRIFTESAPARNKVAKEAPVRGQLTRHGTRTCTGLRSHGCRRPVRDAAWPARLVWYRRRLDSAPPNPPDKPPRVFDGETFAPSIRRRKNRVINGSTAS